ncbi:hypothetical protein DFH27DRAFT_523440 [Peziza echinospora]|nr:hypothetical protein DFH27DRAFT_523440 [Peziza echinospora]
MSSFRFMNNNETTNNPSSNFNNNNNNNTSSSSSSSSSPFTNSSAFNTSSPFNNTNTTDQDSEDLSMSDTEMSDAPVEQQIMQELQQHQQQLQEQQELQQTSVPGAMAIPQKTKAQADLDYQRALLQQKLADKSSHLATSPTDKMMSPCSQKLAERKNKQFGMQSKPLLLSKAFSQASAQKNSKEKEQKRGGLFGSAPVKAEDPIF